MKEDQCKQRLIEGTQKLDPVLNPLGFVFEISEGGVSSAGSFAAGFYKNGNKKTGVIYRSVAGLGAVVYEYHPWSVVHSDLMRYLGKQDVSKLNYNTNRFASYPKGGGNVFDALVYDIQNFGAGFLTASDDRCRGCEDLSGPDRKASLAKVGPGDRLQSEYNLHKAL